MFALINLCSNINAVISIVTDYIVVLSGLITLFEQLRSFFEYFRLQVSVLAQSLILLDDLEKIISFWKHL